jgi:hypothetical protein
MDELFASGIKLAYIPGLDFIFENGDETETLKVQRNRANFQSLDVCLARAKGQKNVSILLNDPYAEESYAHGTFLARTLNLWSAG